MFILRYGDLEKKPKTGEMGGAEMSNLKYNFGII